MKKIREFLSRPAVTAVLFALALLLLGSSTVGGARAALNIQSEYYNSEVELLNIGVALLEDQGEGGIQNFVVVSGKGGLMGENSPIAKIVKAEKGKLYAGRAYPESLAVRNTADINEYVRVAVYKYWVDEQGKKYPDMNSDWITLNFDLSGDWSIDDTLGSTTEERTILYYSKLLAPGEETTPFLKSIVISKEATRVVEESELTADNTLLIKWEYVYNGKQFCLEVLVDGVQDHNVDQAKLSAWGINDK